MQAILRAHHLHHLSHLSHHSQVLFSQMMALPAPRLHTMAYGTIIVDLCKVCELYGPLYGRVWKRPIVLIAALLSA